MAQSQSASQSFFSHMDGEPYEKEEETFSERAMRGLSVRLVQTPIPKGIDVERDKTRGRVEKGSHSGLAVYGDPKKNCPSSVLSLCLSSISFHVFCAFDPSLSCSAARAA